MQGYSINILSRPLREAEEILWTGELHTHMYMHTQTQTHTHRGVHKSSAPGRRGDYILYSGT
jgi:hypothetical protein